MRTFHLHTGADPELGVHPSVVLYYISANIIHANEPIALDPVLNLMKWLSWSEHLPVVVEQTLPSVPSVSIHCSLLVHWIQTQQYCHSYSQMHGCYRHIHESMLCIMHIITLCLLWLHFIEGLPPTHPPRHQNREICNGILVLGTTKPTRINPRIVTI